MNSSDTKIIFLSTFALLIIGRYTKNSNLQISNIVHQTSYIVHASPLVDHINIFYASIRFSNLKFIHSMSQVVIPFYVLSATAFSMVYLP
jgi:hypothetical protein